MIANDFISIIGDVEKKICRVTSAGFLPKAIIVNNTHAAILVKTSAQSHIIFSTESIFGLPVVVDNRVKEIIIGVGND